MFPLALLFPNRGGRGTHEGKASSLNAAVDGRGIRSQGGGRVVAAKKALTPTTRKHRGTASLPGSVYDSVRGRNLEGMGSCSTSCPSLASAGLSPPASESTYTPPQKGHRSPTTKALRRGARRTGCTLAFPAATRPGTCASSSVQRRPSRVARHRAAQPLRSLAQP